MLPALHQVFACLGKVMAAVVSQPPPTNIGPRFWRDKSVVALCLLEGIGVRFSDKVKING